MQKSAEEIGRGLEAVREKVTAELDKRWNAENRKLVPGTELLDEVFGDFGLRFIKLRDGPALAAKLDAADVDAELASILRSLDA